MPANNRGRPPERAFVRSVGSAALSLTSGADRPELGKEFPVRDTSYAANRVIKTWRLEVVGHRRARSNPVIG